MNTEREKALIIFLALLLTIIFSLIALETRIKEPNPVIEETNIDKGTLEKRMREIYRE